MADTIAGWMKAGIKDTEIERRLEQSGNRISRITLGKHRRKHLTSPFERQRIEAARQMQSQQRKIKGPPSGDFMTLIRDNVHQRVVDGELEPSLAQGMLADIELDKRAQKGSDRNLILILAQALGGVTLPSPAIEGEFREIDAEADEDEAQMVKLLAAGS